jgi:hypothetical protein
MFNRAHLLAAALIALLFTSCGGGGSSDCQTISFNLQNCGLIPKNAAFACTEPSSEADKCADACLLQMNCTQFRALLCSSSMPTAVSACLDSCQTSTSTGTFACATGGESYPISYKCDGDDDCSDASDEAGCPTFTCRSGTTIPERYRCDGDDDCSDGSDEAGCPTFMCRNGSTVPAHSRCDDSVDCSDGSDELGCPPQLQDIAICN